MDDVQSGIVTEAHGAAVRILRIDRPEARNAFNRDVRRELSAALAAARDAHEVRTVVITGDDRSFAAGADIGEMKDATPAEIATRGIEEFWDDVRRFPKPLIAAVRGYALGAGFELVLACDIVVAGASATFGLPEVKLGIMPGGGGSQRFPRVAGKHVGLRYALTGDFFGAEEAQKFGVVTDLVADDEVLPTALAIAEKIAALPPLAVMKIKEAIVKGLDAPLETGIALERQSYYFLNSTSDKAEGVAAFLEKRKPRFTGR